MTDPTPETEREETERLLRDSVRAFVARMGGPAAMRRRREAAPAFEREAWGAIGESGWLGLHLPEAAGGLGLGYRELAAVMEELGRGLVMEPVAQSAVLAGGALAASGAHERVEALATGALVPALAFQEGDGDYEGFGGAARAQGGRLEGVKRFVAPGSGADGYVVTAIEAEGPGLWWVAGDAAGIVAETEAAVDGGRIGNLRFDGAPAERLASGDAATRAVAEAVEAARLATAAELVGVMAQALDLTLDYVKERKQFGRPIGGFQALQHRLVDLWTQMELAKAAVVNAATALDRGLPEAERLQAVSAAKARAGDAGNLITRQSIQLWGGMGYTDEADIGLYLKRTLVLSARLGNAAWHRRRFAALDGLGGMAA